LRVILLLLFCGIAACAGNQPQTPYPAFIQIDELPDIFIAGLPGVRAKQLAGNPETQRSSSRIELPAGWNFTTGASPGKSVEIFVLAGEISLSSLKLDAGSYAYVPPGSTGMQMRSELGALLLYFLDYANASAVIQTPLILDSKLVGWQPLSDDPNDLGRSVKILREDPGSGARSWLEKTDPVATQEWQQSSVTREGYLVSGSYHDSECVNGQAATGDYLPGGYFHRVPGAVNGGPEAGSAEGAVWFVRVLEKESLQRMPACVAPQTGQ
jgi:hypothetical protein